MDSLTHKYKVQYFCFPEVVWLQLSLVMAGKLCVHCAYSALCVQIAECFPTVVRAVALGSGLTASRVGAIVAPFFRDIVRLVQYFLGVTFHCTKKTIRITSDQPLFG